MTVRKWGGEALVNTNITDDQDESSIAALAGGGYVISWTDSDPAGDGNGSSIKFQRYDAAGNKLGAETLANVTGTGAQTQSVAVGNPDGSFTLFWSDDNGNSEFRRFAADGSAIDLTDRTIDLFDPGAKPHDVTTLGAGYVFAHMDTAFNDIYAVRLLADGDITGSIIPVADSGNVERDPAIAELAGGGFVVAWEDDTTENIRVRGYDAAGAQTFFIAAVDANAATSAQVGEVSLTALANGSFLVAWHNSTPVFPDADGSVRARIVSPTGEGELIGAEFTINTYVSADQGDPDLAPLPDGGFVAVYRSSGQIRGQVFDAFGVRDGDEFLVITSEEDSQGDPSVAVLADGRFVVTWSANDASYTDDPDESAVRQQIFDPRDGVVTGTTGGETLYGHELVNDELNGRGGNDTLNGLGGSDSLYGGDDDDTYVVGAGDLVFESAGAGTDLVRSPISYALGANVENLTLIGAGAINGTGNSLANILIGNAKANVLTGGLGKDTMNGAGGPDRFDFNAIAESTVAVAGRDAIVGFSRAQHDRIDLSTIDADQRAANPGNDVFVFIGAAGFAAFHATHPGVWGMVRFAGGILQANVNANLAPDFAVALPGVASLVAGDLFL